MRVFVLKRVKICKKLENGIIFMESLSCKNLILWIFSQNI